MTKRELLSLVFKVTGIICVLESLIMGLSATNRLIDFWLKYGYDSKFFEEAVVWNYIASLIFYILAAFFLFKKSDKIAAKLVPVDKEIQLSGQGLAKELFIVAIRIIGLSKFLEAVMAILSHIVLVNVNEKTEFSWVIMAYWLAWIIIAIYLITGAKHLVRWLYKGKKPAETLPPVLPPPIPAAAPLPQTGSASGTGEAKK